MTLLRQRGLETTTEVMLLGDGAAWIWEHISGVLGAGTVCVTDRYHVMEHVWSCGNALHGQGSDQARQRVEDCETLRS